MIRATVSCSGNSNVSGALPRANPAPNPRPQGAGECFSASLEAIMTHRRQRPKKLDRGLMMADVGPAVEGQGTVYAAPFGYRARPGQAALRDDPARFKVVVA